MSGRLRIGVLGAARIAPAAIVRPAGRSEGAVVTAVAARDPARARSFADKHGIGVTHESYAALLEDRDIDAVYNPLPNGLHGRWTLAAIAAGKHVLCEKPFTANAAEAAEVAKAANASDVVVMEAFHYRYHPLARRLSAIMESGELGAVEHIDLTHSAPLARPGDIRYRLDLAGGATMDMGCYPISLLRLLAGAEPEVVSARAKLSSPGVDRAMTAEFVLPGGGSARVLTSMFSSSLLSIHATVRASRGHLRVVNPYAPQYYHRLRVQTPDGTRVERLTRRATYDFQLDAFVSAVRDGTPVLTSADDAVRTMSVIDDVYEAAGLGVRQPT